jgi:hypothetical protein
VDKLIDQDRLAECDEFHEEYSVNIELIYYLEAIFSCGRQIDVRYIPAK